MNISRDNYEIWLIDHLDGKLDAVQTAELLLFLDANPDLRKEFESMSSLPLEVEPVSFDDKESLIRGEVNTSNVDRYLIAQLEGDLTSEEQSALDAFLHAHPQYQKEQELFSLARLQPVTETFPGKGSLKQAVPMVAWFSQPIRYAVAAAIVLLLISGSYLLITNQQKDEEVQVAMETPSNPSDSINGTTTMPSDTVSESQTTVDQNTGSAAPSTLPKKAPAPVKAPVKKNRVVDVQLAQSPSAPVQPEMEQQQPAPVPAPEVEQPVAREEVQPEPQPALAAAPAAVKPMTVLEAVRKKAGDQLAKVSGDAGERELASLEGRKSKGVKVLGLISKGIQKVSGDKVQAHTAYDVDGEVLAFDFKAGGISIEKK